MPPPSRAVSPFSSQSSASADAPSFAWPVRVYYEDTDIGGVVYYANYLKYFERARTEWLRALGIHQFELAAAEDLAFVVRRAELDYRVAAKMDDLLIATVMPVEVKRASMWLEQRLVRPLPSKLTISASFGHDSAFKLDVSPVSHQPADRSAEPSAGVRVNPDTAKGELLCLAKIQVACIRRRDQAVRPFPAQVLAGMAMVTPVAALNPSHSSPT
jgi:acyl-CoA thioester hydrolase